MFGINVFERMGEVMILNPYRFAKTESLIAPIKCNTLLSLQALNYK